MGLRDKLRAAISDGANFDPNERVDRERRRQAAPATIHSAKLTFELRQATREWTLPAVIRSYESGDKGESVFADEAAIFDEHAYRPGVQSAEGGRFRMGKFLMTGGLGAAAGGLHTKGRLTVTFQRERS